MFGLGFGEIVVIALVVLIFLGPQKLPVAAQHLGRFIREFRKATDAIKQNVEDAAAEPINETKKLHNATMELVKPIEPTPINNDTTP